MALFTPNIDMYVMFKNNDEHIQILLDTLFIKFIKVVGAFVSPKYIPQIQFDNIEY